MDIQCEIKSHLFIIVIVAWANYKSPITQKTDINIYAWNALTQYLWQESLQSASLLP